jgi:hypothetical protein
MSDEADCYSGKLDEVIAGCIRAEEAGEPIDQDYGHTGAVMSLDFSPDGTLLASASADFTVRLWGANVGRPAKSAIPAAGHRCGPRPDEVRIWGGDVHGSRRRGTEVVRGVRTPLNISDTRRVSP